MALPAKLIVPIVYVSVHLGEEKKKHVCIFSFYQIRATLKVPPRVPHKVETSLLQLGGKCVFEDLSTQRNTQQHYIFPAHQLESSFGNLQYV